MWMACSPAGMPRSAIAMRTPELACVSVTTPTFLPSTALRSAAAIGIGPAVGAGAVAGVWVGVVAGAGVGVAGVAVSPRILPGVATGPTAGPVALLTAGLPAVLCAD